VAAALLALGVAATHWVPDPGASPAAIGAVTPNRSSPVADPTAEPTLLAIFSTPSLMPIEQPVEPVEPVVAAAVVGGAGAPLEEGGGAGPRQRGVGPRAARAHSGWVCGDSVRLADATGRRWIVDRVSFHAMGGHERILLHLDEDGPASATATVFGTAMASSGVQGSARARSRPAVRHGIGLELAGGLRSGLELRRFRPQGLRTIRELSIQRDGAVARVLITVASDGCFRLRAPAWQPGRSGTADDGQLIIDVRR
jgi:hypothetical protein